MNRTNSVRSQITHLNVAVTVRLFSKVTVQTEPLVPLVELQLAHIENVPLVAVAVSISVVPAVNWLLQTDGDEQLMPKGPVTVPLPVPAKLMVRIGWGPAGVQPELDGPSTTMWAKLLTTSLEPSLRVAETLAEPQLVFGLTTPALVT